MGISWICVDRVTAGKYRPGTNLPSRATWNPHRMPPGRALRVGCSQRWARLVPATASREVRMSARIREHVRSNVIGYIALFVALGGTAWAANSVGSSDVIDTSLQSIDLKDDAGVKSADVANDTATGGGLASADLRADSVGSSEVIDESLGGADIDESTLPVGGDLNGFLSGAQIVLNAVGGNEIAASSVGSSEVIDNSLQGLDINDSSLDVSNGIASSPDAGLCDPASGTFTACASTSLLQSTGASVLVIGSGAWFGTQGFGAADEG